MAPGQLVQVGGRRMRLTRLDKVLYPATGTTKGEVIDYYTRIAPLLLPHVNGRPATRKRWPDGVDAQPFFAKALEQGAPAWVRHLPIEHSTGAKEYPLVDDVPTLVYLAQVASLELHVPQWRFASDGGRENPDRLVLDLDPGPGTGLAECAQVAVWVREILSDMGLDVFPVTSGSKGLHLYAGLDGSQTSDQASALAKELARALEADHPDLVVSRMAKKLRDGRVLLDWSQNSASKTTVAPYSLRGRTHPTVASPRTWQELADPDLGQLELTDVLERAESIGDPMGELGFRAGGRAAASGPLSAYIAKRDPARTPEPVPDNPLAVATPAHQEPRFVIQEHHARRLHWDLRLERNGVFVSWAVPRGVPPTPDRNSLAVMTEDHPLEYGSFEGSIPRGEYGGGTVTIWDDGRYEIEKWRDDEIIFTAHGRAGGPLGSVRLALIRTQGSGEKSSWLLHRTKTDAAGRVQPDGQAPIATDHTDRPSAGQAAVRPMLCTLATPAAARDAAWRWGSWAEMKWDGIRAVGVWDGASLRLFARSGTDITARYPELTAVDAGLGPEPAVVDGEIIALDATGRPSFTRLQSRMHLTATRTIDIERRRTPVRYHLFDVLAADGADVHSRPLAERRESLERLTAHTIDEIVVPPVFDDVDEALATAGRLRLEGIVVKNPGSPYRRGARSDHWLKVKLTQTQEVVIGGIRPGRGGRTGQIGSLLLGIPDADGLRYVGRVGSGFSESTLRRLHELLDPLRTDIDPFVDVPSADARDALWVRPEQVAEVEFAEFSPTGVLRQARWRGLRPDKSPGQVRRES